MPADPVSVSDKSELTGGLIARMTAVLGLIAVFSIVYGWLFLESYLSWLGAPWQLSNTTQERMLVSGVRFFMTVAIGLAAGIFLVWRGKTSRYCDYISLVLILLSTALFIFAAQAQSKSLFQHVLFNIAWIFSGFNAGFTLGEMFWGFSLKRYVWGPRNGALLLFVWSAMTLMPSQLGWLKAVRDADPQTSRLTKITAPSLAEGDWRVVEVNGDMAVVVRLTDDESPRLFAVTKLAEAGVRLEMPSFKTQSAESKDHSGTVRDRPLP